MNNKEKGFGFLPVLLTLFVIGVVGAAGYVVYTNNKPEKSVENTETITSDTDEISELTLTLETAPVVSVKYDTSWQQLKEFGYARDGLTKSIDGVEFLISFTRTPLSYDYMDRSVGGAYPPGKPYKEIIANEKNYFIGTTEQVSSVFLSTCAISANGGCSLSLPDDYGYMIVDMQRFTPTSSSYSARSPLDLNNSADKKAIEEFVEIMRTLKF